MRPLNFDHNNKKCSCAKLATQKKQEARKQRRPSLIDAVMGIIKREGKK